MRRQPTTHNRLGQSRRRPVCWWIHSAAHKTCMSNDNTGMTGLATWFIRHIVPRSECVPPQQYKKYDVNRNIIVSGAPPCPGSRNFFDLIRGLNRNQISPRAANMASEIRSTLRKDYFFAQNAIPGSVNRVLYYKVGCCYRALPDTGPF